MPRFKLTGIGRDTGCKRTHKYWANNLDEALQKASKEGTIVDMNQIEEIPDEPSTEKQKKLATELGLIFSPDIIEHGMSVLLTEALKDKKYQSIDANLPPTERQIEFMKEKKQPVPKGITRRELSKIIDKIIKDEDIEAEIYRDEYIRYHLFYEENFRLKDEIELLKMEKVELMKQVDKFVKLYSKLEEQIKLKFGDTP